MICRNKKCERSIPDDALYCCYCGIAQEQQKRKHRRSNGMGSVYKRSGKWEAKKRIYADGMIKSFTKGGFATKKDAEDWLKCEPSKKNNAERITFSALYSRFIERHSARVSKSTIGCYKASYGHFEPLYYLPYADITTEDFQECIDMVDGKRTRQNMKALGTLMDKYATELQIIDKGFAQFIWIENTGQETRTPFTQTQFETILNSALHGDEDAKLIAVDCMTGFRPAELFDIRKADCTETLLIGGAKTEKGKNRHVPVSPKIRTIIRDYMRSSDEYLFRTDSIYNVRLWREKSFYKCLDRLGIQSEDDHTLTPYSCRHYFATRLKSIDGVALDKSTLMGHTSPMMTEHYQHTNDDELIALILQI